MANSIHKREGWAEVGLTDVTIVDGGEMTRGMWLVCQKLTSHDFSGATSESKRLEVAHIWAEQALSTLSSTLNTQQIGRIALWDERPKWADSEDGINLHYVKSTAADR